ncbi:MAG: hypothetical protein NTZ78_03665 [Candidatus Aureabacteria bacterium]|nr:hypothetical protein [Candidatus Auribacterota bacterium]
MNSRAANGRTVKPLTAVAHTHVRATKFPYAFPLPSGGVNDGEGEPS